MKIYNRTQVISFQSLVTKSGYYTYKVSQGTRGYNMIHVGKIELIWRHELLKAVY